MLVIHGRMLLVYFLLSTMTLIVVSSRDSSNEEGSQRMCLLSIYKIMKKKIKL